MARLAAPTLGKSEIMGHLLINQVSIGNVCRLHSAPRHRYMHVRAANEDPAQPSSSDSSSSAPLPPRIRTTPPPGRSFAPPPSALQPDLKLQKVETLGADSIAGVAAVDRGENSGTSLSRGLKLAAGDAVALLVFATIGRFNHHEGLVLAGIVDTALPFLVGWFVTAPFLGGYGKDAQSGNVGKAVGAAAKSWVAAIPVALVVRSVLRGYVPDKSFIIVSFVATAVLLLGARAVQAGTMTDDTSDRKKKKKGNPFEFISLLTSLVKRW